MPRKNSSPVSRRYLTFVTIFRCSTSFQSMKCLPAVQCSGLSAFYATMRTNKSNNYQSTNMLKSKINEKGCHHCGTSRMTSGGKGPCSRVQHMMRCRAPTRVESAAVSAEIMTKTIGANSSNKQQHVSAMHRFY